MGKAVKRILYLICIILVSLLIALLIIYFNKTKNSESNNTEVDAYESVYRNIYFNGKEYSFNDDITTILFMGIDQSEAVSSDGYEGTGGRSDCLILLIVNEKDKTIKKLDISRDTMTDVEIYDIYGDYYKTVQLQIAMQYAYGNGAEKSCRLTKKAVSNLLYNIPIDYYLSVNINGIESITNAIGGVEISFDEDYINIEETYIKGNKIILSGAEAERFVRYRESDIVGSNNQRMNRQDLFFDALVNQIQKSITSNPELLQKIIDVSEDYFIMDLDADTIDLLSECTLNEERFLIPGDSVNGTVHDEYIVNEDKLRSLIVELFYILK